EVESGDESKDRRQERDNQEEGLGRYRQEADGKVEVRICRVISFSVENDCAHSARQYSGERGSPFSFRAGTGWQGAGALVPQTCALVALARTLPHAWRSLSRLGQ